MPQEPTYAEPYPPQAQVPFQQAAPYEQSAPPATFAPPAYNEPTRAALMAEPQGPAGVQAATATAQNQSDLWFLSTEPADAAQSRDEDMTEDKQGSSVLTAVLTIGMAILVIVLVLVFIQLMTSLLR
jgi:hypothetical protein